jgi:glycerol-3-phosphate O-acyltransferase
MEKVVRQAVLLLEKNNLIQAREHAGELEYETRPRKRNQLNYYKNNIIHFLVDEMILASSLLTARRQGDSSVEAASANSYFLSKVMKWEFIYKERSETETRMTRFEAAFGGTVSFFEDVGWVQRQGDQIEIKPEALPAITYLHECLWPYIESYQLAALLLPQILTPQKWVNKKDVTRQLLKRGQNQLSVGLVRHPEAIDKTTFENAMRVLIEMKALEQRYSTDKKGRRVTEYGVVEDARALARIKEELDRFTQEADAAPASDAPASEAQPQ